MTYTPIQWQQRFQNLERAFISLQESQKELGKDDKNLFVRDSLIQRYEYTIELAWKTLKDYLEEEWFTDISSPKQAVRQGFKEWLIKDGNLWIKALDDRNKTSHAYDENMAEEVTEDINNKYFSLLRDLYFFFKQQIDADK